jgi:hypothetical protein
MKSATEAVEMVSTGLSATLGFETDKQKLFQSMLKQAKVAGDRPVLEILRQLDLDGDEELDLGSSFKTRSVVQKLTELFQARNIETDSALQIKTEEFVVVWNPARPEGKMFRNNQDANNEYKNHYDKPVRLYHPNGKIVREHGEALKGKWLKLDAWRMIHATVVPRKTEQYVVAWVSGKNGDVEGELFASEEEARTRYAALIDNGKHILKFYGKDGRIIKQKVPPKGGHRLRLKIALWRQAHATLESDTFSVDNKTQTPETAADTKHSGNVNTPAAAAQEQTENARVCFDAQTRYLEYTC